MQQRVQPTSNLINFLKEMDDMKYVLPDFQRDFVWTPDKVQQILISILGNFFPGLLLVLEGEGADGKFKYNPIDGVREITGNQGDPEGNINIILDGQQRCTSIYYAFKEPPGKSLRNKKYPHLFYFDLNSILKEEWDESVKVVSTATSGTVKKMDATKTLIRPKELLVSKQGYEKLGEELTELLGTKKWVRLNEVFTRVRNFQFHFALLEKGSSQDEIVETFSRLNLNPTPLTVYDLVVARHYKQGISMKETWDLVIEDNPMLEKYEITPENILRIMCLMRDLVPKKRSILEMPSKNFESDFLDVGCSLAKVLLRLSNECGALTGKQIPYRSMLVPLTAIFIYLEKNKKDRKKYHDRIWAWYWYSIFSSEYDSSADTTGYRDYKSLIKWVETDEQMPEIKDFIDNKLGEIDFYSPNTGSAIYKGTQNLLLKNNVLDFETGQPLYYEPGKTQDDHLFPKKHYKGIKYINSAPNRTLITSNTQKSTSIPGTHFSEIQNKHPEVTFKKILESHYISEDALKHLIENNFSEFWECRVNTFKTAVKKTIEQFLKI